MGNKVQIAPQPAAGASPQSLAPAIQEPQPFVKASTQLSHSLGVETGMMIETIKAQCFKGKNPAEITDAQLAAFVSVCVTMKLNPLIPGFVYAYPERNGGITPIMGPDGTMKKLDEATMEGKLAGYEVIVFPEDASAPPTHATAKIWRKDAPEHPAIYTAYFKEWSVDSNPNWKSRPRHMIWIRALKQAARQVIHGLPMDDDEYKLGQMLNVTDTGSEPVPERPKIVREKKGAAAVVENQPPAAQSQPQGGAIDVAARPVTEKEPDLPAAAKSERKEPVSEPPAAANSPRTELNADERIVVLAEVLSFDGIPMNNEPSVKAEVKGDYVGTVRQIGGAKLDAAGKIVVPEPWKVGRTLKFGLNGRLNKRDGKVYTFIESVALADSNEPAGEQF